MALFESTHPACPGSRLTDIIEPGDSRKPGLFTKQDREQKLTTKQKGRPLADRVSVGGSIRQTLWVNVDFAAIKEVIVRSVPPLWLTDNLVTFREPLFPSARLRQGLICPRTLDLDLFNLFAVEKKSHFGALCGTFSLFWRTFTVANKTAAGDRLAVFSSYLQLISIYWQKKP